MATVPPLPYIPLEVGENIIDQLDEHVDSLRSCALTCRGWSRHARQHLIASIRIQSREDLYSICDYITSTPRISSFIRSVSLTPAPTAKKPRFFLDVLPVHLLMRLPNLQRYCIADYRDAILFHSIALVNLKAYVLVRELRLERVRFHTGAELARFLIALPQLRRLECHEVRSSAAMTAGPARFRDKCPKLSEVAVRCSAKTRWVVAAGCSLFTSRYGTGQTFIPSVSSYRCPSQH